MKYIIKQDALGKWTAYQSMGGHTDLPMGDYKNKTEMLKVVAQAIANGGDIEISVHEKA